MKQVAIFDVGVAANEQYCNFSNILLYSNTVKSVSHNVSIHFWNKKHRTTSEIRISQLPVCQFQ